MLIFLQNMIIVDLAILLLSCCRKGHLKTYQTMKEQCGTTEIVLAGESDIFIICDTIEFINNIKTKRTKVPI
jgi:hypothetical protein